MPLTMPDGTPMPARLVAELDQRFTGASADLDSLVARFGQTMTEQPAYTCAIVGAELVTQNADPMYLAAWASIAIVRYAQVQAEVAQLRAGSGAAA